MRRNIVEGEPGIFPDPIARLMRSISRWVSRRTGKEEGARQEDAPPDRPPSDADPPPA